MNLVQFIENKHISKNYDMKLVRSFKLFIVSYGEIEYNYLLNDQIDNYLPIIETLLHLAKMNNHFNSSIVENYIDNFKFALYYSEDDFKALKFFLEDSSFDLNIYVAAFDGKFI